MACPHPHTEIPTHLAAYDANDVVGVCLLQRAKSGDLDLGLESASLWGPAITCGFRGRVSAERHCSSKDTIEAYYSIFATSTHLKRIYILAIVSYL